MKSLTCCWCGGGGGEWASHLYKDLSLNNFTASLFSRPFTPVGSKLSKSSRKAIGLHQWGLGRLGRANISFSRTKGGLALRAPHLAWRSREGLGARTGEREAINTGRQAAVHMYPCSITGCESNRSRGPCPALTSGCVIGVGARKSGGRDGRAGWVTLTNEKNLHFINSFTFWF